MGMFVCTQEVMDLDEYGYVRVSAVDQNEARQMLEMKKLGIKQSNIFLDKQSGKDFNRPSYQKLLTKLKKGEKIELKINFNGFAEINNKK